MYVSSVINVVYVDHLVQKMTIFYVKAFLSMESLIGRWVSYWSTYAYTYMYLLCIHTVYSAAVYIMYKIVYVTTDTILVLKNIW